MAVLSGIAGEMLAVDGDFTDFVCELGGRTQTALSLTSKDRLHLWG
jgi:hypothetical protein